MELAQITNPVVPNLSPGSGSAAVGQFSGVIGTIIRALFVGGVIVFLVWFLIGAVRWITSGGDKGQLEGARNQVLHAVIGLVVLFSLFAILKVIEILFGVSILNIDVNRIKI